jgi:hypothetical protein
MAVSPVSFSFTVASRSHDEEPPPAGNAEVPIHGEHTGSDQAAETVPELLADEEGGVALPELLLGIPGYIRSDRYPDIAEYSPRREVVQSTREEHGFRRAQEDTDAEESAVRLGGSGAC